MEDATVREGSRRFVFRLGAGVREFLRVLQAPDGGSRRLIAVLSLVFFAGALGFSFRALQHLGHFQANTKQNLEDCKEFKCTLQALEAKIQEEARLAAIRDSGDLSAETEGQIKAAIDAFAATFVPTSSGEAAEETVQPDKGWERMSSADEGTAGN